MIYFLFQSESQVDDSNIVISPTSSATSIMVNENDSPCLSTVPEPRPERNSKRKATSLADEVLRKVSEQLDAASEDKFDITAKHFANKLRSLSPETAIVTEKLMSDILFEAQMGNVGRHTKVVLENKQPHESDSLRYHQLEPMQNNTQYCSTFPHTSHN